jgi:uncharacterized membrane protein
MVYLMAGLALFLGVHTFTMFRGARAAAIRIVGETYYKLGFSIKSAVGLVLIVIGFGRWRAGGAAVVWHPPLWTHDVTAVAMWLAFVALACMGKAPGRIRGFLKHPMLVAVKLWAFGHLLANGDVAGVVLFGSFLAWAVVDRIAVKRRGDVGAAPVARFTTADGVAVVAGSVVFVVMFWAHRYLIGVPVVLG